MPKSRSYVILCTLNVSAYIIRMPTFNKIAQTTTSATAPSIRYVGHGAFLLVFLAPTNAMKHRARLMSPTGMSPLDSIMSTTITPPMCQYRHVLTDG